MQSMPIQHKFLSEVGQPANPSVWSTMACGLHLLEEPHSSSSLEAATRPYVKLYKKSSLALRSNLKSEAIQALQNDILFKQT
jgi:hypothetical protein